MPMETPLALLAGLVFGAGLFVAVLAVVGLPDPPPGKPKKQQTSLSERGRRLAFGIGAGLVALLATKWVVAGLGIGLLVAFWDKIAGSSGVEKQAISRLEGLAAWTESLRDTIAGAIGLEQAIPATAANAAASIRPSLNLMVDRIRIRTPLPESLTAFAEDLDDSSADVICAALILNARLRGPGLRDVLTALAASTREELDMRRRIESSRKSIRRSVRLVLLIVLGMMGGLSVLNREYVAPYNSVLGQMMLLIIAAIFLTGLLWLRSLAAPSKTERFLVFDTAVATTDEVETIRSGGAA